MAESGHVINVTNLNKCIGFAHDWGGSKYQPSNPILAIGAMQASAGAGEAALDNVQVRRTPYRNATGVAVELFEDMGDLTKRVMRMARGSGLTTEVIDDLKTYSRKILGYRASPKKKDDPNTPEDESKESVSASQLGREQRIENFDSLRSGLDAQPLYAPNEVELRTSSLKTFSDTCKDAVTLITSTFAPFSNSLSARDLVLYVNADSVVNIGKAFKLYVEGAFGRNSNEWNQVKGLEFRDLRRTK